MSELDIAGLYEAIAQITRQMLIATQHQDWELLKDLEERCAVYAAQLKEYAEQKPAPITGDAYERKLASIKQMLTDDREIRNLMTPWMVKLENMYYPSQVGS